LSDKHNINQNTLTSIIIKTYKMQKYTILSNSKFLLDYHLFAIKFINVSESQRNQLRLIDWVPHGIIK